MGERGRDSGGYPAIVMTEVVYFCGTDQGPYQGQKRKRKGKKVK